MVRARRVEIRGRYASTMFDVLRYTLGTMLLDDMQVRIARPPLLLRAHLALSPPLLMLKDDRVTTPPGAMVITSSVGFAE